MTGFHVVIVPVGRFDAEELEAAAARAARVVRAPLELREALPLPHGSEDPTRGQHRAALLLGHLRDEVPKLRPGKLVGADDASARPGRPDAFLFITDVDLYTDKTEGVLGALLASRQSAVVSVRRLREAFYRRRADPARQRSRLVKEILRMWGRLRGAPGCADPTCALAPSRGVPDIDAKSEKYCRACEQRLFEGRLSIGRV